MTSPWILCPVAQVSAQSRNPLSASMVAARSNLGGEGNLQLVIELGEIKLFSIVQRSFQNMAITNPTETTTEDTPNSAICFSSSIKMTIHPLKLNNNNKKTNKQKTPYFHIFPYISKSSTQTCTCKILLEWASQLLTRFYSTAGWPGQNHTWEALSQYVPGN